MLVSLDTSELYLVVGSITYSLVCSSKSTSHSTAKLLSILNGVLTLEVPTQCLEFSISSLVTSFHK